MLNDPIPPHVDPRKLADRGTSLQGELLLADLERLCDPLSDTVGTVQAKFVFERDERKSVVIHSFIDTEVKMVCQRCLELVTLPIHSECSYAVVKEGANTQSLPKGYDVLELGEDPLDLHALIEEELLLALPIVPAHHPEECQQPAGLDDESEPSEDEVTRSKRLLSWRFGWYSRVLAQHCAWPGCSALLTDVRDVFFQADPLARLHGSSAAGKDALAVFLEYFNARTGNVAIGDDYFNSGWIRDCWGAAGLARLTKQPIANAGVLAGSRAALQRYLTVWQKEQQLHGGRCNDQGVHNWLLHTGRLDPVIAHRQGAGLVNNLGLLKGRAPLTRDAAGFVLDANGMRSAAVHQWTASVTICVPSSISSLAV